MSASLRSRRMARNHRRLAKPTKLNLVALMDIFTILVLFLIVNNGDVEVLQTDKRIALPESVSEQRPEATLIVKVTESEILVNERSILQLEEAIESDTAQLPSLHRALTQYSARQPALAVSDTEKGRPVVVMGHEQTPYRVLKKILATCAATDYRDVSLAVNSRSASSVDDAAGSVAPALAARSGTMAALGVLR